MDAQPVNPDHQSRAARWLIPLALIAALVAAYLAWTAWSRRGLPVGCGDQGGCAEVLTSRWSTLVGIPIGAVALPVYLAMAWSALPPRRPATERVLGFAAGALLGAAVWFVWLQAAVLRAFCPWCVLEHALGLALAGLALVRLRAGRTTTERSGVRLAAMLGILSVAALGTVQYFQPAPSSIVRAPAGSNPVDATDGPVVSLLQGHLKLAADDDPRLGDAAAPKRLYLMFDYCCPHCRRAHEYLIDILQRHPRQLNIVCLPTPRDADCNPAITQTEERFEHACELAELALALWRAKPEAFAEFDRWLFAPSRPPQPQAARRKAIELVSAEPLEAQLAGDEVRRRIARNVRAFNDSRVEYLPVMMAPEMATIVGRPESREALLKILTSELLPDAANE